MEKYGDSIELSATQMKRVLSEVAVHTLKPEMTLGQFGSQAGAKTITECVRRQKSPFIIFCKLDC